jgi:hypothetical protein
LIIERKLIDKSEFAPGRRKRQNTANPVSSFCAERSVVAESRRHMDAATTRSMTLCILTASRAAWILDQITAHFAKGSDKNEFSPSRRKRQNTAKKFPVNGHRRSALAG